MGSFTKRLRISFVLCQYNITFPGISGSLVGWNEQIFGAWEKGLEGTHASTKVNTAISSCGI